MYRANQLWIVAEEDLKDMLTPGLTLEMLPGRTMVLCENAEEVDKWARRVQDSAGFMDDYEPQLPADEFYHPSVLRGVMETCSFLEPADAERRLTELRVPFTRLESEKINLEDAFIGLTGKY